MFVDDLKPKMSKLAVKKDAKEKNPENQIGYVKSLYFAYLFMKSRGLFNKVQYAAAYKYNQKEILFNIMHADEKIQLRTEQAEALVKKKKKEVVAKPNNLPNNSNGFGFGNFVKKVNTIGYTSTSNINKAFNKMKSRFVGKTKTTKRF